MSGGAITETEAKSLARLEGVIRSGLKTFVEVGNALQEIKDGKLYRAEYGTFEKYVQGRWNMSRRQAYRLIEASEVHANLCPIGHKTPTKESVARELAKAPAEHQAEVWQAACEEHEEPTAKEVAAKRQELLGDELEADSRPIADEPARQVDPVVARARAAVPDLCRKLGFNLGNLGAAGRFDGYLAEIEEFAR